MTLAGQRVLVTGGSSGIGRAIAAALAREGARIAVNARGEERLSAVARELGCEAIAGDVGREEDARRIVATFVERFGGIDVLVNNAGFGRFGTLLELEARDFEAVFRTNVVGAFLMAREAARHFTDQRSGTIVNIGSTAATKGFRGGSAYAASKFALRALGECWRDELRRSNVRVILVNPSEVLTDFASAAGYEQEASERKLRPEDVAHAVAAALAMHPRGFVPELSIWATNPF